MSYRKEVVTRVTYFSVAFIISCLAAATVAILTEVITNLASVSDATRAPIVGYSALTAFGVVCGTMVYKIDKKLSKRFNKNP